MIKIKDSIGEAIINSMAIVPRKPFYSITHDNAFIDVYFIDLSNQFGKMSYIKIVQPYCVNRFYINENGDIDWENRSFNEGLDDLPMLQNHKTMIEKYLKLHKAFA